MGSPTNVIAQQASTNNSNSNNSPIPFGCSRWYGGFSYCDNSFHTIDYPNATNTYAVGINNAGQIVGFYYNNIQGPKHGFLLSSGTYTPIDYPNANSTYAVGINNAGQIVGVYYNIQGQTHGFLLSSGTYTPIDYPNATSTTPVGINDVGQIVGYYFNTYNYQHGFLLSSGTYTPIDYPNATSTDAMGINNAGQIVGRYILVEKNYLAHHCFLLSSGAYDPSIDSRGCDQPYGINNVGHIVGSSYLGPPPSFNNVEKTHGFLFNSGTFATISTHSNYTVTHGINDADQIVGFYVDSSGVLHGFLLLPIKNLQTTPEFGPVAPIILTISILSIIILSIRTRFLRRS